MNAIRLLWVLTELIMQTALLIAGALHGTQILLWSRARHVQKLQGISLSFLALFIDNSFPAKLYYLNFELATLQEWCALWDTTI